MNNPPPLPPIISTNSTITYEVTRWDVFLNSLTILFRNRLLQIFVPVLMLSGTALRMVSKVGRVSVAEFIFLVVLDLAGFTFLLIVLQTLLGFVSAFLMQHPGLVCRHTLEITEAGLIERTEVNESLHRWPNICRIFSFAGYLYVYVGQDNVHMIPKRDLTPAALAKFESDLRERAKMK